MLDMNEYLTSTKRIDALQEYVREWFILRTMPEDSDWFDDAFTRVQELELDHLFSPQELQTARRSAEQMQYK